MGVAEDAIEFSAEGVELFASDEFECAFLGFGGSAEADLVKEKVDGFLEDLEIVFESFEVESDISERRSRFDQGGCSEL